MSKFLSKTFFAFVGFIMGLLLSDVLILFLLWKETIPVKYIMIPQGVAVVIAIVIAIVYEVIDSDSMRQGKVSVIHATLFLAFIFFGIAFIIYVISTNPWLVDRIRGIFA